eukprot:TRINITY_DN70072_c0_g1_i1.p1 TRINITY_DN70072_c0_g1~~TRINITY_DN70072_c0_g1_i1.p1  ORF type:complete len:1596 (-),score=442.89 TRINITY_DN70072_c0_g1_i1:249-5036(-)
MELLIAGSKFPAKCVKNEIHNLLTTLRLTKHTAKGKEEQFYIQSLRAFQRLFEELTYTNELQEFDAVAYLGPFIDVIQSDATDGEITAVALGAVDKFVSFGLINPDSPRCMDAVNALAWGIIGCRFVSSGGDRDEAVLLKIANVMINTLRCPAGEYLGDMCVWHMVKKCFQIARQPRSSHLLRASTESTLQQMVLTIFGTQKERARRIRVLTHDASEGVAKHGGPVRVHRPYGFRAMLQVLRFLAFLMAYGRSPPAGKEGESTVRVQRPIKRRQRSRSVERRGSGGDGAGAAERGESPAPGSDDADGPPDLGLSDAAASGVGKEELRVDTHCLGLSLLNIAMESGGDEIAKSDELVCIIQDDICKHLLQNSRSESLSVLSLTLRAIFNLFLYFRRHLKVQLEIFFTSVHLKIAGQAAATYEQRELALESLVEFCREPELMLEVYENYDCDVRCTNLFETLVKFLVTNSLPNKDDKAPGQQQQPGQAEFNSLHRLAISGVTSIVHLIALRCEVHGHYREDAVTQEQGSDPSTPQGGTQLQRKKEQKRRLTIAARTFNNEPFKCMGALQTMGLVSNPATAESMGHFLRHTPGLDLRLVGEYLSKRKDFNAEVRTAFVDLFDFQGLGVVEALRMMLSSFRLPGESQLIERLMESFAEGYYTRQVAVMENGGGAGEEGEGANKLKMPRWVPREKQPEDTEGSSPTNGGGPEDGAGESPTRIKMSCSDTIFVLSYSIIMLNTDLHNPGVKKRMTVEEFIRNNRKIDDGKDLPPFFLTDIYEAIRDDEIRLHGESVEGTKEPVMDDFFWEGILRKSECIDEFSATERALLSERPPSGTEQEMLQVIMDCNPIPTLSKAYETAPDPAVAAQAMMCLQDMAKINFYYGQVDAVTGLVRVMCQYFSTASSAGMLTVRSQIALSAAQQCVANHSQLFRETEWRMLLDVLMQLWALDLLPSHLTEFDDFSSPDGKKLESLCNFAPPFSAPATNQAVTSSLSAGFADGRSPSATESGSLLVDFARWFEDEVRDSEAEDDEYGAAHPPGSIRIEGLAGSLLSQERMPEGEDGLPIASSDPAVVHEKVKQYVNKSTFVSLFTAAGVAKHAECLQTLARALVQLSRPQSWGPTSPVAATEGDTAPAAPDFRAGRAPPKTQAEQAAVSWHALADPVLSLELLTNLTCMPIGQGQNVSQIWPLVSTHFETLLQFVQAGNGLAEREFIERLVVNTLRLCIRLSGNSELLPMLLSLTEHLSKLPGDVFALYSERIACGILVLLQQTSLPHSGLRIVFALLRRISETPGNTGACSAGLECLNHWLVEDAELARLLSMQQFPELLATLRTFAMQSSTPASFAALEHLSSLVPQLARGSRCLLDASSHWQPLWVPTLQVLADIAKDGSQKSSAQAFVYLQRLLLERGAELSLPWEQVPFEAWKECLEQVLLPLLRMPRGDGEGGALNAEVVGMRQASAAQLLCHVVLTHLADWIRMSPDGFPALFLRLLHVLVSEATTSAHARDPLEHSMKNLLLVISMDPAFGALQSPKQGETMLEATWAVVTPSLPQLQQEVALILDPNAACEAPPEAAPGAAGGDAGAGYPADASPTAAAPAPP